MSRTTAYIALIVAALAATIPFLSATRAEQTQRIVIEIRGFKFIPENPVVRPGDVIVWRNTDIVPHTASARSGSWDSGLIAAGGQWEMLVVAEPARDYRR